MCAKCPPSAETHFLTFFPNDWEFLDWILHTCYFTHLLLVPTCAGLQIFLSSYVQFWWSNAILSVTTQFTSCVRNVHHRLKGTLAFSDIIPKQLRIFGPNFTRLLNVPIYARIQNVIQLSPTVTKLWHIKCDHPASVSTDGGHFEHKNGGRT